MMMRMTRLMIIVMTMMLWKNDDDYGDENDHYNDDHVHDDCYNDEDDGY